MTGVQTCALPIYAAQIVEGLGVPRVIMLPDEYLALNTAKQVKAEIITWKGRCMVHEMFTPDDIRGLRANNPDVIVLAHPECSPEVVAAADFAGSTAAMIDYVGRKRPAKVALITECSMSDNVAVQHPDLEFIRPCQMCPHMKKITLQNIRRCLEEMKDEVTLDPSTAARARQSVEH